MRNEEPLPHCAQKSEEQRSLQTEAVCYRGGPVLHDPTVHLIFWQGPLMTGVPKNSKVSLFTAKYEKVIENYFEGLAAESGKQSNVFAVDPQYFEEQAGLKVPGEYKLSFDPTKDVIVSEEEFPAHTQKPSARARRSSPKGRACSIPTCRARSRRPLNRPPGSRRAGRTRA